MSHDANTPAAEPDSVIGASSPLRVWSVAWMVAVLLGGLAVNAAAGGLTAEMAIALVAGLVPPLVVLVLGRRREDAVIAVPLWAAGGAVAAALTGGMGGPMAAWCVAPLVMAAVIDRRGALGLGAACSGVAILAVAFLQLTGSIAAGPVGLTAFSLGLTAVLALVLGAGAGFVASRRLVLPVAAGASSLLDDHPFALLRIGPDNLVAECRGRLQPGIRPGQSVLTLAREEDRARLAESLAQARAGERPSFGLVPAVNFDRWFVLDLLRREDGWLIGALHDETIARDREEALEAARTDAENLAAGKSRFLASMSHELRTPLNAIMGFSDIMRNRMFGDMQPKYVEYAQLIHESGTHLLDLISDVLDMSKIEAQKFELHTELHDAREPVSAALRILRHQADEAGVNLRANLPSAVLEVEADRRAIKQIVINLVSNALKFTPAGGSVIVAMTARERDLDLTVVDTGVGIAPEDLARLGRPYEQAGDAARRQRGTGLGLSLVRSFAELHGGTMVIESRMGEGTAVTVTMPVVLVEDTASPPPDNVVALRPQG